MSVSAADASVSEARDRTRLIITWPCLSPFSGSSPLVECSVFQNSLEPWETGHVLQTSATMIPWLAWGKFIVGQALTPFRRYVTMKNRESSTLFELKSP